MAYQFPPWIKAPDIAAEYQAGLQIGQQAAFEQQRLQMQQEESQRQHLMDEQRLQVEKSFRDQQLSMQKQELDQATQLNAIKTQDAAQRLAAQKAYTDFVNAGGDPTEGLLKFGPAMGETMSGYAGLVKDVSQAKHPFVPTEMTTPGGTRLVQLTPGRFSVAPKEKAGFTDFQKKEELKDAYKELDEARKAFDTANNKKAMDKQRVRVASALSRIRALVAGEDESTDSEKPTTPESKLEAAKALRKLHPDWTKQQIIDAVNQ